MNPSRAMIAHEWSGALLTWRGAVLLGTQFLVMSTLGLLSIWLPDLTLLGRSGLLLVLFQVATLLAVALSAMAGALAIAGERDQATLESLLLTPVGSGRMLRAKWVATASLGALCLLLSLPYLLVLGVGQGIGLGAAGGALTLALLLVVGYTGITVAISSLGGKTLGVLTITLGAIALLEGPGLLAPNIPAGRLATALSQISPANQVFGIAHLLLTNGPLTGLTGSWIALAVFLVVALLAVPFAASQLELVGGDQ
jgi:ABC-2 type transport system permease protein